MKILIAQPAIQYYTWQLEVTITSLIENKVDPGDIHIVSGKNKSVIPDGFVRLQERFPEVVWAFYHDNRSQRSREYIPSIRPHIIKKHWRKHPELQDEVIFYMEADTILLKPIPEKIQTHRKMVPIRHSLIHRARLHCGQRSSFFRSFLFYRSTGQRDCQIKSKGIRGSSVCDERTD